MAIEKITEELDTLNIISNSGDTHTRETKASIEYSMGDGDAQVLSTVLEKIVSKLNELTDKINSEHP